jgi:uncharacterized protein (DUF3820 family)
MITDETIVPFGKHKGKKAGEVPNGYWLYMYDRNKLTGEWKKYAEQQVPILRFRM